MNNTKLNPFYLPFLGNGAYTIYHTIINDWIRSGTITTCPLLSQFNHIKFIIVLLTFTISNTLLDSFIQHIHRQYTPVPSPSYPHSLTLPPFPFKCPVLSRLNIVLRLIQWVRPKHSIADLVVNSHQDPLSLVWWYLFCHLDQVDIGGQYQSTVFESLQLRKCRLASSRWSHEHNPLSPSVNHLIEYLLEPEEDWIDGMYEQGFQMVPRPRSPQIKQHQRLSPSTLYLNHAIIDESIVIIPPSFLNHISIFVNPTTISQTPHPHHNYLSLSQDIPDSTMRANKDDDEFDSDASDNGFEDTKTSKSTKTKSKSKSNSYPSAIPSSSSKVNLEHIDGLLDKYLSSQKGINHGAVEVLAGAIIRVSKNRELLKTYFPFLSRLMVKTTATTTKPVFSYFTESVLPTLFGSDFAFLNSPELAAFVNDENGIGPASVSILNTIVTIFYKNSNATGQWVLTAALTDIQVATFILLFLGKYCVTVLLGNQTSRENFISLHFQPTVVALAQCLWGMVFLTKLCADVTLDGRTESPKLWLHGLAVVLYDNDTVKIGAYAEAYKNSELPPWGATFKTDFEALKDKSLDGVLNFLVKAQRWTNFANKSYKIIIHSKLASPRKISVSLVNGLLGKEGLETVMVKFKAPMEKELTKTRVRNLLTYKQSEVDILRHRKTQLDELVARSEFEHQMMLTCYGINPDKVLEFVSAYPEMTYTVPYKYVNKELIEEQMLGLGPALTKRIHYNEDREKADRNDEVVVKKSRDIVSRETADETSDKHHDKRQESKKSKKKKHGDDEFSEEFEEEKVDGSDGSLSDGDDFEPSPGHRDRKKSKNQKRDQTKLVVEETRRDEDGFFYKSMPVTMTPAQVKRYDDMGQDEDKKKRFIEYVYNRNKGE